MTQKELKFIEKCKEKVLKKENINFQEALKLICASRDSIPYLIAAANQIKLKFVKNKVILCGIVNAKSGKCSENCSFCAQSAHYKTKVQVYPIKTKEELIKAAKEAKSSGSNCFSIVTSGKGINTQDDIKNIYEAVNLINKNVKINKCSSLGILSFEQAKELKRAGLNKYHHNLETAKSYFKKVCTTHTYEDRINTVKNAKEAGLKVCSGGIIGLGETAKQRVELAFALKELDVESVPINILNPIAGTKAAQNKKRINPLEVLKTIAVYRFILPNKIIGVFGGREKNLRDLQSMIFWAGANSMLMGNYLTTSGRPAEEDLAMLSDLELVR
ncbi:MAG: biotin synthase BioB [Candidatus Margulisbacteria bacterium]|nr:biotin synthase BioB [Candidatus Margulisiibacteriota bacterium]